MSELPEFDKVLTQYSESLGRLAASYEADRALQEELLQEILLAIWQGLKKFRGESSIRTFVFRIAHNRAINHTIKSSKAPDEDETDVSELPCNYFIPEKGVQREQKQQALLQAIRQLPIVQRELVILSLEGLSYDEISNIIGISVNNVGVRLNRAKATLKRLLSSKTF